MPGKCEVRHTITILHLRHATHKGYVLTSLERSHVFAGTEVLWLRHYLIRRRSTHVHAFVMRADLHWLARYRLACLSRRLAICYQWLEVQATRRIPTCLIYWTQDYIRRLTCGMRIIDQLQSSRTRISRSTSPDLVFTFVWFVIRRR